MKHRLPSAGPSDRLQAAARLRRRGREDGLLQCCRCSLSKLLCGVMGSLAIFVLALYATSGASSGHPQGSLGTEGGLGREGLAPRDGRTGLRIGKAESEEDRLQREVISLESELTQKKAILGVDPQSPLPFDDDNNNNNAGDTSAQRTDGWNAMPPGASSSIPGAPAQGYALAPSSSRVEPQVLQQEPDLQHDAQHPRPTGLHGEPLFGYRPERRPLTTDANLIRTPVPLIVGGTDGSGTRGVVALLQRLKVPMIIEDGGTLDVHGAPYMSKGGWPGVVRPVVKWAGGAGYESYAAPTELRKSTLSALHGLKTQMEQSSTKVTKSGWTKQESASYVSWGFKAPVSMLLVPFFEESWMKAKFLHVIRDGRDIAFSGNQTPVSKFYDDTFPAGSRERTLSEPSLMAIRMWSVWNGGLYEWAARRPEGAAHLDYLLLHVEDLIDPSAKFAAIKDVAEFVGSPLTDKELCCIATEPSRDMGSHTAVKSERGKVTNRFGKWRGKVEDNAELSASLHEEGAKGLQLFGYHPERSLRRSDGYQCSTERQTDCPAVNPSGSVQTKTRVVPPTNKRANTKIPERLTDTEHCVGLMQHTDFKGRDLTVGNTEDHLGCCEECRAVRGCTHFTFDYASGTCYLKTGIASQLPKDGLVSGAVTQ